MWSCTLFVTTIKKNVVALDDIVHGPNQVLNKWQLFRNNKHVPMHTYVQTYMCYSKGI